MDKSQREVPDNVQCSGCIPRGAGNTCFIEQTKRSVSRESPRSSVSTRMPRSRMEIREEWHSWGDGQTIDRFPSDESPNI